MPKVFAKSIFLFMTVTLLLSGIHIGCSSRSLDQNPVARYYEESAPATESSRHLDQNQQNGLGQPQKTVTSVKRSLEPAPVTTRFFTSQPTRYAPRQLNPKNS